MLTRWLGRAPRGAFIAYASVAAFGVYFCMYAYRRPFTAATYEGLTFGGVDYKILLIVAQVLGYTLFKFYGIRFVSELTPRRRAGSILGLIGLAELALLGFALVPAPYNVPFLFLNGMPLALIWGIVFSYLEGRTSTEMLAAGLSVSFIVSSGAVKSVGAAFLSAGVSAFWMPFVTGLAFAGPLVLFVHLLEQLPPPSAEDVATRTERRPMTGRERRALFVRFAPGLVLLLVVYVLLTAFRDYRDNFAAELWQALGYGDAPLVFTYAELPVAVGVLALMGSLMFVRDNRRAFGLLQVLIVGGVALAGGSTWLYQTGRLDPAVWMVLVGLGLYVSYIPFGSVLFDRMLAAFRHPGTAGYLIYVADAVGYLGSVALLLYKNFGQPDMSWLGFFVRAAYALAAVGLVLGALAALYFHREYHTAMPARPEAVPEAA